MSADQETRLWLTMLCDYIEQRMRAAIPFARDGKLDLSSNNIVGTVPQIHGGSGTNTGAEPALGNPAANGDVLSSTTAGVRSWITPAGSGALDDLTDVTITTPADDDVLTYNSASSAWVNQAPASGLTNPMTTADDVIIGGTSGTPARLAKGGNNTVLGVDGSGVLAYKADPTGGSGATIGSGTTASRPAAGNAGDLYLPTDAIIFWRDDGAAWQPFGPVAPLTAPPAAAGWTAVNAGSATLTDVNSGLLFADTGNDINTAAYVRSLPAAPYTATAGLIPTLLSADDTANTEATIGLVLRESSSGKLVTLEITAGQGSRIFRSRKWTNSSTFSATYASRTSHWLGGGSLLWLRIVDNTTNRLLQGSSDGRTFVTLLTVGRTDFCTPDQLGVFLRNWTGGAVQAVILSWTVA
jgi:hypothetical protein